MRKKKPSFSWDTDSFMKIHVLGLFLIALAVIWTVKTNTDNDNKKSVSTQSDQRPEK